jgi:hypothetical protein
MEDNLLSDAIGRSINEWFGGNKIDVHQTLDASRRSVDPHLI